MYCTRRALISVKGMSEQKIDKILDAGIIEHKFLLKDSIQFFLRISNNINYSNKEYIIIFSSKNLSNGV
jgi:hypothetical protein